MTCQAEQAESEGAVATAVWVLYWLWSKIGWVIARVLEALARLSQWFDLRVHHEGLRIRAITEGQTAKPDGHFAILLVYCEGPLPAFTRSFVEAVERSSFDLIAVCNSDIDDSVRSYLLAHSRLLIERHNVGRDFGGYKDAIAVVGRRFPQARRLLLANDSVFYLPQGLDKLLADLAGDHEFIGVSEIFEHHYHVASFLASFGPAVLASPAFRNFWDGYRPYSLRRWAILRGEGALTATLTAAGFRPHVLYQTEALRRSLERYPSERIAAEVEALPAKARIRIWRNWRASGTTGRSPTRPVLPATSPTLFTPAIRCITAASCSAAIWECR